MPILRFDEFPEGSGSLTNDDIFLFMDDPSGSGITKKISLTDIGSAIGGGGGGSGITLEEVQDNLGNSFLVAGTGVSLNYSDASGTLTISSPEAYSLVTTVFNKTASQINKFSVVYIDGGQGDMPTIKLAIASGESGSSKTYGITAENIASMSTGKVIVYGALNSVNTDQFNPTAPTGDVNGITLYLSPTVSGGVTTTKPSAPNHMVSVGTIVRTHQNQGVVEVKVINGFEIEELHNVAISGISDNQILVYDSGTGLWKNENLPSSATTVVNLAYSSGITTDASSGDIFDITASGSLTLNNPTNVVNGKTLRWRIRQDSVGNRSISLGNKFNIPSSATNPLPFTTSPSGMDILAATYHSGRDKWDVVAFVPGY